MPRYGFAVVDGHSMEPTLRPGDRLLVDYRASRRAGAMAIVVLPERPLGVKRLQRRVDGRWWIASDNAGAGVDSSDVGLIDDRDVLAVVRWRVWPIRRRRSLAARRTGH